MNQRRMRPLPKQQLHDNGGCPSVGLQRERRVWSQRRTANLLPFLLDDQASNPLLSDKRFFTLRDLTRLRLMKLCALSSSPSQDWSNYAASDYLIAIYIFRSPYFTYYCAIIYPVVHEKFLLRPLQFQLLAGMWGDGVGGPSISSCLYGCTYLLYIDTYVYVCTQ